MANFFTSIVVSSDDSVHSGLSPAYTVSALANDKHVLFILVVRLGCSVFFLRIFASN